MNRTGLAVLLGTALVGAGFLGAYYLGSSDDSDSPGSAAGATTTSTTTSTVPPLDFVTPDGYRHSFRVTDTRVGLGGTQAVVEIEIANALDRPDRRLNRPHGENRRLMIAVNQERFGGACPPDRDEPYDYDIYVAVAGYCVITSSSLSTNYSFPGDAEASETITLTADLAHTLGVGPADIAVFFFDPLLALTPVRELAPEGATYDVVQRPECVNPVSGELRPECEAAFHPDLFVAVP